jgi:hypothetical protein
MEMNVFEEQADSVKARKFHWKPLSWLGTLNRPTTANDAWDHPLWETFFYTTLGFEVPVLASLPRRNQHSLALCCCKKHGMDLYCDHMSTCTAHSCAMKTCTARSCATKTHDWAVRVLGPLFRSVGHVVRTQHGVTANAGQQRSDVEVRHYLHDTAGSLSLVFDLSIKQDRISSRCHVQQNGLISYPRDLDTPLWIATHRKINSYRQQYPDNQNNFFSPLHYVHFLPYAQRVFASSFSKGPQ